MLKLAGKELCSGEMCTDGVRKLMSDSQRSDSNYEFAMYLRTV